MSRLLPFVFVGVALAIWEAAARSGLWSPLLFPSLARIFNELVLFFSRPESMLEAWVSLERALGGFALAAVVGILLGILMGRSRLVAALLDPLFSGTYAVPKLALFPIFIFVLARHAGGGRSQHRSAHPAGQSAALLGAHRKRRAGDCRRWRATPQPQPAGPRAGLGAGALGPRARYRPGVGGRTAGVAARRADVAQ
jgi:ABC-type proline/glycine betaine transport system permease subunit